MALNIPTTFGLREHLFSDVPFDSRVTGLGNVTRRVRPRFLDAPGICGGEVATRIHEALIKHGYEGKLVGHIYRDSTAIDWLTSSPSHHASLSISQVCSASQGMKQL